MTYGIFEENLATLSDGNVLVFNSFIDLEGDFVDGTVISSSTNEAGGIIKLEGVVRSLTIGGQGLAIDDLCGTQLPAPVLLGSSIALTQVSASGMVSDIWEIEVLNAEERNVTLQ